MILGMGSTNERCRYIVTASLIGLAHTQNVPWNMVTHLDMNVSLAIFATQ